MASGVRIKGAEQLRLNLSRIASRYPQAAKAALYQEGQHLLAEAKTRTPVHKGTLRGSGFVQVPTFFGKILKTTVGFGGAAAPYAAAVHERITNKKSGKFIVHEVGRAKFLTWALYAVTDGYLERMRKRIIENARRMNFAGRR